MFIYLDDMYVQRGVLSADDHSGLSVRVDVSNCTPVCRSVSGSTRRGRAADRGRHGGLRGRGRGCRSPSGVRPMEGRSTSPRDFHAMQSVSEQAVAPPTDRAVFSPFEVIGRDVPPLHDHDAGAFSVYASIN